MKTVAVLGFFCLVAAAYAGNWKKAALDCHNQYRAKHGAPPMKLDNKLSSGAQQWADKLAGMGMMQHAAPQARDNKGENLYYSMPPSTDEEDVVKACKAWYDEVKMYNFNNGGFSGATGHFTQLVWKESTKLGIGIAKRNNKVFVVARYDPAGNFMGKFKQNVLQG